MHLYHHQEALYIQLVYFVRAVPLQPCQQTADNTQKIYQLYIQCLLIGARKHVESIDHNKLKANSASCFVGPVTLI
jgi:hypothetical protein